MTFAAAVLGLLYLVGLMRRSYWILALPLTVVVGAGLGVLAVLGRLLATTPPNRPHF